MHFFHHHHNKKNRIAEDNDLLQRRVDELDAENNSLRGGEVEEEVIVREDIAKNAHLMNAPVSNEVDKECVTIKRRSASVSANDLALGEADAHTLRAGQTTRIVCAAASAQGGAGSSGALESAASESSAQSASKATTATTVRRIISKEPARIIRAEIIRPEKHVMSESKCTTEKKCAAKDGDTVEEIDVHRKSLDEKTGDVIEEDLKIKSLEREVPKKSEVKTETHVNYVPMGRPKAHDRLSPTPASEVVDHLDNKLGLQVDAHEIGSRGTPLHKDLAFPLPEDMTKLPKGLDADKARLKTFERDVELSHEERLVKRNAIIEGVLKSGSQEQTFEEELEFQKIVHQL